MSSIDENILTIVLYAVWINLSKVCLERALQQMGLTIVKLWLVNDVGQMPKYRSEISGKTLVLAICILDPKLYIYITG